MKRHNILLSHSCNLDMNFFVFKLQLIVSTCLYFRTSFIRLIVRSLRYRDDHFFPSSCDQINTICGEYFILLKVDKEFFFVISSWHVFDVRPLQKIRCMYCKVELTDHGLYERNMSTIIW